MSVFSVVSDVQSGLFRMQQAKKPWEKELEAKDAKGQLAQKAERAQAPTQALAKWQSDHAAARAALEEARRVSGPKAAAAARLEQVERRIEELKLAMRFAHGDPQKLASLARAAALLAREAGRAAKEYGGGMAAAAELGLPGDSAAATGGGGVGTIETSITRTTTSLTVQQTEVTLSIGITTGEGASADSAASSANSMAADSLAADSMAATAGAEADAPAGEQAAATGDLPPEIAKLVDDVLAGLGGGGLTGGGRVGGGLTGAMPSGGSGGRAMIQQIMADNGLKMSRYREADTFGQRVEAVLATSKQIIGEAKAANMLDPSEKRRRERREGFKADDKMVDAAQKEVNGLRSAALGSRAELGAAGLLGGADEASGGGVGEPTAAGNAVDSAVAAQPSVQASPQAAPAVDMLA